MSLKDGECLTAMNLHELPPRVILSLHCCLLASGLCSLLIVL